MINTYPKQSAVPPALALARHFFSARRFCTAAALALLLGAGLAPGTAPVYAQSAGPPPATRVHINSADAETIAAGLKGVGHSRALEIVRHRETFGPFASLEELAEVKGIGKSTLDKNRTVITLD